MDDHTKGVLEGLGYCLTLSHKERHGKISRIIRERIIEIVEATASDLEFRMKATAQTSLAQHA
jgi:hypothetical protein